jgi:hypothetical protein
MMKGYHDFVEAFEKLTPYELDHFSKLFFEQFRILHVSDEPVGNIRKDDLRNVITAAMQAAHMEIALRKVSDAQTDFDLVKISFAGKTQG